MLIFLPDAPMGEIRVEKVGGKAAGLFWLQSRGFRIPQTWVLSTEAFDAAVDAAGVRGHIAVLEEVTATRRDWAGTELALQGLASLRRELVESIRSTPLPERVRRALQRLPQDRWAQWAVRSSATVEDSNLHSFAGQFQSRLSVPGGPPLVEAVREVWISVFDKTVLHYRAEHGIGMPRMAVIFQPMEPITEEDRAGTAFSQSTVPGLAGVLIQSTFGAGVTVVGGGGGEVKCVNEVEITTFPQPSPHILVTAPEGGLQRAPARLESVLTDAEAALLARTIREIAPQYGRPVDVEFIWRDGEEPMLVQVRPITTQ